VDTSSQGGSRGDANRVFVSNLPWSVDNSARANLFRGQGKVLEASIAYDRDRESGRSKGFGFVTYGSAEEVSKAISNLDGAVSSQSHFLPQLLVSLPLKFEV
jgi:nucleolin